MNKSPNGRPDGSPNGKKPRLQTILSSAAVQVPVTIGLGAIAGALSRYYLTSWIAQTVETAWPVGTFCVNLAGAFAMGLFTTLAEGRSLISPRVRLMMAVGFLGSFTTFSTYELESEQLVLTGSLDIGLLYWIGSTILGVISLEIGNLIANRLSPTN